MIYITDYMVIGHCPSNYLIPIIGLSVAKIREIVFEHLLNFFRNFPLNSKGSVNIHKIKDQMTYILVQDGKMLS